MHQCALVFLHNIWTSLTEDTGLWFLLKTVHELPGIPKISDWYKQPSIKGMSCCVMIFGIH